MTPGADVAQKNIVDKVATEHDIAELGSHDRRHADRALRGDHTRQARGLGSIG